MDTEGLFDVLLDQLAPEEIQKLLTGRDSTLAKLSELRSLMTAAKNVLNYLDEKQNARPLLKNHLNKVKHALYDAEDIIDEIRTAALQQGLSDAGTLLTQGAASLDAFYEEIELRIECTNKVFEGFKDLIYVPGPMASSETQQPLSSSRILTTSLVGGSILYGRDSEREQIIDILQDRAAVTSHIRVVALIGVPGIGKTALAQSIFNDPNAGETFDFKTWISVPEVSDISQIITSIFNLLPTRSPDYKTYGSISAAEFITNLEFIQWRLRQRMAGMKFLIVLDDVWEENIDASWDALRFSLNSAATGSTIVVTTHNKDIARRFHPSLTLQLHELSDDDCWSLIKACAWADPHAALDESLEEIGRRIAAKCRGLPIAAKALGGLLAGTSDAMKWESIETSRIWDLPPGRKQILPALLLCYKFLPPHLRRGTKEYFDMLVERSFFQESGSNEHYFIMHGLMHELAVYVMTEFSFSLEANISHAISGSLTLHHLSFEESHYETAEKFSVAHAARLRTFLPIRSSLGRCYGPAIPCSVLLSLAESFRCMRHLDIRGTYMWLPEGIGRLPPLGGLPALKHLIIENFVELEIVGSEFYGEHRLSRTRSFRSLKILEFKSMGNWRTWFTNEADVSRFPCLEELHMTHCQKLKGGLPSELSSLKVLTLRSCDELCEPLLQSPHSSPHFPDLEELHLEDCEKLKGGFPMEFPFLKVLTIRSCGELCESLPQSTQLRELIVEHCPNVVLRGLAGLTGLTSLGLCWKGGCEILKTHESITNVEAALPNLTSLHKLQLGCYSGRQCIQFQQLTQEPLSLPPLHIRAGDFQKLNYLRITGFCRLREFDIIPEGGRLGLTFLYELSIAVFPQLSIFPAGGLRAHNLTILRIKCCNRLRSMSNALPDCFPSLRCLSISHCPLLESFAEGCLPIHLQTLRISRCENLRDLPMMARCTSLHLLEVDGCFNLELFPASVVPPNLRKLKISNCPKLTSLSDNVGSALSCLELLHIWNCPEMESFPPDSFPPNLEILHFEDCPRRISNYADWQIGGLVFLKELVIKLFWRTRPSRQTNECIREYGPLRSTNYMEQLQRLTHLKELRENYYRVLLCF
ncbi:hypothetical protein Cgig2_002851 [Carnegiea gigantea]|uniref:Disease resistance protein n=1 Tax=Carnegiea gigantea TaxID=171969 RepID=A0A9Q1KNC3_9CARY|nr:hypothetical protein Cgig2_002851 [Carnegiea gigantea]